MSITDFRPPKRESLADRRAQDREDRRLADETKLEQQRLAQEAEDRRREQDRLDKQADAEQKRAEKAQAEEQKRERAAAERAAKEKADKERAREKARRQKERRERRTAAVKAAPGWIAEHLDLAAALVVMACSIVPALISQGSSLSVMGLDPWMVALLPVMLEASAWAATAGEAKAMAAGRAVWPYRFAVWLFAGFAGAINWAHGYDIGSHDGRPYGPQVGAVLAASSIVPIGLWQLVQLGRHREAREKSKADRKKRRDQRKDREARKERYKDVWETALDLRAIAGRQRLSEDDAWQAAWAVWEGASEDALPDDLLTLLSAELLGLRVEAEERLAQVLGDLRDARARRLKASGTATGNESTKTAETVRESSANLSAGGGITPPTRPQEASATGLLDRLGRPISAQVAPSVPPSARTREDTPPRTRTPRPAPPKRTLSKGAKNAARETALKASGTSAADEKKALEEWALDVLRKSGEISWQAIQTEALKRRKETDKKAVQPSRSWSYDRRTAAIKEAKRHGLHLVQPGERSA